jgi:hypothetical protein
MNTNESLTQHPHRIFQPFERQGIHAVADQLLNDADALAVLPITYEFDKSDSLH